jgi:hypothetical protein
MKLLLKYPSRARPELFTRTLDAWMSRAAKPADIAWLVSLDADDDKLDAYRAACNTAGITPVVGTSRNKVHAINRDLHDYTEPFDVLLNVSDDMRPVVQGWDDIVRADLPSPEWGLWYADGRQTRLCTLAIEGRALHLRKNRWVYHPAFVSVYADDHWQHVLQSWVKLKYIAAKVFRHEWGVENRDALMKRNEDRHVYQLDRETFRRLRDSFDQTGEAFPSCAQAN